MHFGGVQEPDPLPKGIGFWIKPQTADTSQSLCDTGVTSPVMAWSFPATGILECARVEPGH